MNGTHIDPTKVWTLRAFLSRDVLHEAVNLKGTAIRIGS